MTSVQDRLERAHDALTLIVATCNGGDANPFDQEDLMEAVARTALAVREDIYWLRQVPGIGSMSAPAMDAAGTLEG